MKLWKRLHRMLAVGTWLHQKYIIGFQDQCSLRFANYFITFVVLKFQSHCYYTALFRRSFLSFKMLWWSLWFRRIWFIWNWQLHDRHPLNWPKQSQLLDYLSPAYMFARSVFEKEEQKVLIVRCLVLCAVRIFYRFLGWYGGFHDHRTQSEINHT